MAKTFSFFYVPMPNPQIAKKIGRQAVMERLAACANILPPSTSIYEWKGKLVTTKECVLILKTPRSLKAKLVQFIKKNHPYETPAIVTFASQGYPSAFNAWLKSQTGRKR